MKTGTVHDITLYSKELGEERQLLIYLPQNYSPLYKYSILIASDGKDFFQLGRIPRVIDGLLEEGEIENVIVVGVPYKSVKERHDIYHPSGERTNAYMRFLAHELVPYLDENYPTYQVGNGRALIGDSLAATISFTTAAKYPNIFGKAILLSPYVDDRVLEIARQTDPKSFSVYHIIGLKEDEVKMTTGEVSDFLQPNRELNKIFTERGFDYFYDEFNGNHSWKFWQPDLKRVMKMKFGI